MDKLTLHSPDLTQRNLDALAALFPSVMTESRDAEGNVVRTVDFDLLRQELADHVVEGPQERYQLDWPGKRAALFVANAPIAKTLRPTREESVDFDTTRNLFIEGDNLEALKLLQESYLGKVKLIYIDPPYNTGNDFVYNDDFAQTTAEYLAKSKQVDEQGNRLVANMESNGRFHSDWLSMMYPRLKLARNLLSEGGLIFMSIDSHEVHNLRKICDEVFGAENHRNTIAVRRGIKNVQAQFDDLTALSQGHEYILMYARSSDVRLPKLSLAHMDRKPGKWDTFWRGTDRQTMRYEILGVRPETGQWRWEPSRALEAVQNHEKFLAQADVGLSLDDYYLDHLTATNVKLNFVRKNEDGVIQYYVPPSEGKLLSDNWMDITLSGNETDEFDTEKSVALLRRIVQWACDPNGIVLDFFAGSATTAHAVMDLNAEDGGNRQFILVQYPESTPEGSTARNAGYATIAEISKERIRRAGKKIKDEAGADASDLDNGFRALRIDSTNLADVRRTPGDIQQSQLDLFTDSVKEGRSGEDLLFEVLLNWGLELTLPIHTETIDDKQVLTAGDNDIIACFDDRVTPAVVRAIAERQPLRAVFRDSGFASDAERINAEQIFREVSPVTEVKAI